MNRRERKEQLEIVLRLNSLTKRGKLQWSRDVRQDAGMGLSSSYVYYTRWKNQYQVLVEKAPLGGAVSVFYPSGSHRVRIRHVGSEEDWIVIPPMAAIDDLVDTIVLKNDYPERSAGDLDELRSFRESLEEDL